MNNFKLQRYFKFFRNILRKFTHKDSPLKGFDDLLEKLGMKSTSDLELNMTKSTQNVSNMIRIIKMMIRKGHNFTIPRVKSEPKDFIPFEQNQQMDNTLSQRVVKKKPQQVKNDLFA